MASKGIASVSGECIHWDGLLGYVEASELNAALIGYAFDHDLEPGQEGFEVISHRTDRNVVFRKGAEVKGPDGELQSTVFVSRDGFVITVFND